MQGLLLHRNSSFFSGISSALLAVTTASTHYAWIFIFLTSYKVV